MWQGRCAKDVWELSAQTGGGRDLVHNICASPARRLSVQAQCCKRSVASYTCKLTEQAERWKLSVAN
eukprot:12379229-Alexandrium_andersonii.AAC.1